MNADTIIISIITLEKYLDQIAGLRARSISSSDRPFVSTTLPAMYMTARRQTIENPKQTELIPNLFTKLKKYSPMTKFDICSTRKSGVGDYSKRYGKIKDRL